MLRMGQMCTSARKVCVCLKKEENEKNMKERDSSRQENLGHDSDPLMNPHLLPETPQPSPPLPHPLHSITSSPSHPIRLLSVCNLLVQRQVKFPDITLNQHCPASLI